MVTYLLTYIYLPIHMQNILEDVTMKLEKGKCLKVVSKMTFRLS